jgi:glycosyltransferase involved in cell wall biosynthesis
VSGVEEYTHQLATHMIPLDSGITYTLFFAGRHPVVPDEAWIDFPNVRLSVHERSARFLLTSMRCTGQPRLDEMVGGADVFFFPHFIDGVLSPHCPRVLTFHDLSFERFPEFFSWRQRIWHQVQMRPRHQARAADRLIAVSKSTARDLTQLYRIDPGQISVVYSGINPMFRRVSDEVIVKFRNKHRLPERFIFSLCTREPRKNLTGLVQAFELLANNPQHRDLELYLAGPPGWLGRELDTQIRCSSVAERIHTIGPIDRNERPLWYTAASVFAYPSFFEGFGFPPLEAMACGTPVVSSRTSSLSEVVGDAGLLIDPYDIQTIASALHSVLMEGDLSLHFTKKGVARAAKFSWESAAEQTLQALVRAAR